MFFILSTGRCGSTSIADLINLSPDCICFHEPEPILIKESTQYLYHQYPHKKLVSLLQKTRKPTHDNVEYGESNLKLSFIVPALNDAFPNAKYIWLIRDGRDVVSSMYARKWYNKWETGIWDEWRIQGNKTGSFSDNKWNKMDPFEKCCWYWIFTNNFIEHSLSVSNLKWIRIRLEDLQENKDNIFKFLNISPPISKSVPHSNKAKKNHKVKSYKNWSLKQQKTFSMICGVGMEKWYGEVDFYGKNQLMPTLLAKLYKFL